MAADAHLSAVHTYRLTGVEPNETNTVFALLSSWFYPSLPCNTESRRLTARCRRNLWNQGWLPTASCHCGRAAADCLCASGGLLSSAGAASTSFSNTPIPVPAQLLPQSCPASGAVSTTALGAAALGPQPTATSPDGDTASTSAGDAGSRLDAQPLRTATYNLAPSLLIEEQAALPSSSHGGGLTTGTGEVCPTAWAHHHALANPDAPPLPAASTAASHAAAGPSAAAIRSDSPTCGGTSTPTNCSSSQSGSSTPGQEGEENEEEEKEEEEQQSSGGPPRASVTSSTEASPSSSLLAPACVSRWTPVAPSTPDPPGREAAAVTNEVEEEEGDEEGASCSSGSPSAAGVVRTLYLQLPSMPDEGTHGDGTQQPQLAPQQPAEAEAEALQKRPPRVSSLSSQLSLLSADSLGSSGSQSCGTEQGAQDAAAPAAALPTSRPLLPPPHQEHQQDPAIGLPPLSPLLTHILRPEPPASHRDDDGGSPSPSLNPSNGSPGAPPVSTSAYTTGVAGCAFVGGTGGGLSAPCGSAMVALEHAFESAAHTRLLRLEQAHAQLRRQYEQLRAEHAVQAVQQECLIRRREEELRALRHRYEALAHQGAPTAAAAAAALAKHGSPASSQGRHFGMYVPGGRAKCLLGGGGACGGSAPTAAAEAWASDAATGRLPISPAAGVIDGHMSSTAVLASPGAATVLPVPVRASFDEEPWAAWSESGMDAEDAGRGSTDQGTWGPVAATAAAAARFCWPHPAHHVSNPHLHAGGRLAPEGSPSVRSSIDSAAAAAAAVAGVGGGGGWPLAAAGHGMYPARGSSSGGGSTAAGAAIRFHSNPLSRWASDESSRSSRDNSGGGVAGGAVAAATALSSPASSCADTSSCLSYGYRLPPYMPLLGAAGRRQQAAPPEAAKAAAPAPVVMMHGTPVALRRMRFGEGMTVHENEAATARATDCGDGGGGMAAPLLVAMRTNPLAEETA